MSWPKKFVWDFPYDVIENLMLNKSATMGKNSDVVFDLSKITYVFLKDTPTNNPENIMDDGMSQYLYDQFDEIICFNRLTKEQIKEVKALTEEVYTMNMPASPKGIYTEYDIIPDYIAEMTRNFGRIGEGLKIVVDSANATGGIVAPEFAQLLLHL